MKKNKKIEINFTEEDLQDLMRGRTFDWTFPVKNGKEEIDVHLYFCEDEDPKP